MAKKIVCLKCKFVEWLKDRLMLNEPWYVTVHYCAYKCRKWLEHYGEPEVTIDWTGEDDDLK